MAFAQCKISLASDVESTTTASRSLCTTAVSPTSGSCREAASALDSPAGGFSMRWRCGARFADGSHGCIYRAFNLQTGQIFATKVHAMKESDSADPLNRKKVADRLAELEELRHPNIVEHLGHDIADVNLYIYLEYVGGSLQAMLQEFGPFRGQMLGRVARGVLEGLAYLHTREPPVVHGSVASCNILVSEEGQPKLQCFQFSRHVAPRAHCATLETLSWMAPEVFQKQGSDRTEADIWSAGWVIVEMATGEAPWAGASLDQIRFALGGGLLAGPPLPTHLPTAARACAAACLQPAADSRPTARALLEAEFVACAKQLGPFGLC
uniref:Protein kinase domain-containing protein n=1 Tax=Alexandrium catenella TaxID=2925 RepID=A0A7S1QN51_ALECA|mmetsp:Transcript_35551/g.96384  ORF Transcript_35551/g.96384 Transcript_35551/m.96384 type:complete len:324 (+) Transcript_35551:82-1053(+)